MSVRVLVVDDDQRKLARIIQSVTAVGVARELIDVAQTGSDARRLLAQTIYDLLVLDVALPFRAEDQPDRQGGVKLLNDIVNRPNAFKLPLSVLGLTAYDDLHDDCASYFHSRSWALDFYDFSDDAWVERLKAKAKYILDRASQTEENPYKSDICVITGLHSPELEALRRVNWNWSTPTSFDEVSFVYEGHFRSDARQLKVVASAAPRMGMVATAVLSMKMIAHFRPRLLAMIGICGGLNDSCDIGDVLVANPSWDWQMGKHSSNSFEIAPDQIGISTAISERFVQLGDDRELWFTIREEFAGVKPSNVPKLRIGPVTSGSAVLANAKLLGAIKEQHRKLVGVEMELYGMYAAARDCSSPNPKAFGVKSVCDFADKMKDDTYHNYAAHVSARALVAFCERFGSGLCFV